MNNTVKWHYFACSVGNGNHCSEGKMKVAVMVHKPGTLPGHDDDHEGEDDDDDHEGHEGHDHGDHGDHGCPEAQPSPPPPSPSNSAYATSVGFIGVMIAGAASALLLI